MAGRKASVIITHEDGTETTEEREVGETTEQEVRAAMPDDAAAPDAPPPPAPRYFDPTKHPEGDYIPGVGLRDYSGEEWAALPKHVQGSAAATGWWATTPPAGADPPAEEATT